jgi:hypothetical protein
MVRISLQVSHYRTKKAGIPDCLVQSFLAEFKKKLTRPYQGEVDANVFATGKFGWRVYE